MELIFIVVSFCIIAFAEQESFKGFIVLYLSYVCSSVSKSVTCVISSELSSYDTSSIWHSGSLWHAFYFQMAQLCDLDLSFYVKVEFL